MSKEKETVKKSDEIVINLDSFAIPGAIILVGILIALAIYFSGTKAKVTDSNTDTNTSTDVEGTEDTGDVDYSDYVEDAQPTSIDDDPYVGNKETAKVAIIEFSDYLCSYCQRHAQQVYPSIKEAYLDTGKAIYVFRDTPFHGGYATKTAEASECVAEIGGNGKFEEFHQEAFGLETDDDIYNLVKKIGVDESKFKACYTSNKYAEEVQKDLEDSGNAGITGTPSFVIGILNEDGSVDGKVIPGALPFEVFQQVIDEALAQ